MTMMSDRVAPALTGGCHPGRPDTGPVEFGSKLGGAFRGKPHSKGGNMYRIKLIKGIPRRWGVQVTDETTGETGTKWFAYKAAAQNYIEELRTSPIECRIHILRMGGVHE